VSAHHLPQNWIEKLCVHLSIPGWMQGKFPHQTVRFFEAWAQAEGGSAEWNPLNTTNHVKDAWGPWQGADYNRITVANYKTPFDGIAATAATLLHSTTWTNLLADLRANTYKAEDLVKRNEGEIREWGTNPDLMLEILGTTP